MGLVPVWNQLTKRVRIGNALRYGNLSFNSLDLHPHTSGLFCSCSVGVGWHQAVSRGRKHLSDFGRVQGCSRADDFCQCPGCSSRVSLAAHGRACDGSDFKLESWSDGTEQRRQLPALCADGRRCAVGRRRVGCDFRKRRRASGSELFTLEASRASGKKYVE